MTTQGVLLGAGATCSLCYALPGGIFPGRSLQLPGIGLLAFLFVSIWFMLRLFEPHPTEGWSKEAGHIVTKAQMGTFGGRQPQPDLELH